jgi:hypothetical protein
MTKELVRPEAKANLRRYADITWRDVSDVEHIRYVVRPMKPGPGVEVIDTSNHANWSVKSNFHTETDALEWMRTNRAP